MSNQTFRQCTMRIDLLFRSIWRLGQWFRTVTGLVEVTGAIALLIPVTAGLGRLLLAVTMCFAIFTHLLDFRLA